MYIIKRNCLNAAKIYRKLQYLEKKKINAHELKEILKHKAILKTQQIFKSETHNMFPLR